jgi:hypothetical protein
MPVELGGCEIEATEFWGGCPGGRPEYILADSKITITMPEGTPMEAVRPPLPPEPPKWSIVLVGDMDVFQLRGRGEWRKIGNERDFTWAEVCGYGEAAPQVLVPDPLAGAPELPWGTASEAGRRIALAYDGLIPGRPRVRVSDDDGAVWALSLDTARQMGLALLRAAEAKS